MSEASELELLDVAMEAYERAKQGYEAIREHVPLWIDYIPRTVELPRIELPEPVQDGPDVPKLPPGELPPGEPPPAEEDDGWLPDIEWFVFGAIVDWLVGEPCIEIEIDYRVFEWGGEEEEGDGEGEEEEVIELRRAVITFASPVPWAARVGDPVLHGGGAAPGPGSPDVFIGGLPALRVSDSHVCPLADPDPHVGGPFVPTYEGVLINGMPALRVGDAALEGTAGPNPVIAGCPSVEIGPVPEPVVCVAPVLDAPPAKPEIPKIPYLDWDRGKIGEVKGTLRIGLSLFGPFVAFEGQLTAAHLYAEYEHSWEYSLGDPDFDGKEEFLRRDARYETENTVAQFDVDAAYYPLADVFWWEPSRPKNEKVTRQIEEKTRIVDEDGNDEGDWNQDEDGKQPPPDEPEEPEADLDIAKHEEEAKTSA